MVSALRSPGAIPKPDVLLSQLTKLVEGWDPPDEIQVSKLLATQISSLVDQKAMTVAQTELDSHANMCVFGKHCIVISESKRTVDVNVLLLLLLED